MGTQMNYVHFHYINMLFLVAHSTKIGHHTPGVPFSFCILGHQVTIIHTHLLWRTNPSTQLSFNAGVTKELCKI